MNNEDKKEIELSLAGIANLFLMGKYYDSAIQKVEERINADGSDETSKFIATSKNYLLHALTKSIVDIKKEITRCTDKSIAIRSRANCTPEERADASKYEAKADALKEALAIIYNYVDIANNLIVEDYKKRARVTNVVRSGGLIITSSKEEEEDEY